MGLSNYSHQALLASLLGKTSNFGTLSAPPTLYVGLSSTEPQNDGTNVTEPSTGAYARVVTSNLTWGAPSLADPSISATILLLTFPTPTGDWEGGAELGWTVMYDALTVGNFVFWAPVGTPRAVLNGDSAPVIAIGEGTIELGGE